jgi:hypothetical protein
MSHFGYLLHNNGVVYGVVSRLAPGKRAMVFDQDSRHLNGINVFESLHNNQAGFFSYSPITSSSFMSRVQGISRLK